VVRIVTGNYFDVLRVTPLGRGFRADEDAGSTAGPAIVISDGLWRRMFCPIPQRLGAASAGMAAWRRSSAWPQPDSRTFPGFDRFWILSQTTLITTAEMARRGDRF
jgi:hypothetical protein